MAAHEWLVVAYFAGLALAAWSADISRARLLQATALGVTAVLGTVAVAFMAPQVVRAWAPHAYLVAGYWMPVLLVAPTSSRRFEEWLATTDSPFRRALPAVPRPLVPVVELAYLLCYPLVPISFGVVWLQGRSLDVERFWLAVLVSGYACYVTLPWLVSQPPRLRRHESATRNGVARINAGVLDRVSHRFNTFPSGHVAVASAAAASVAAVSAPAGAFISAVVVAISVGAAAGGYHYVIDVILGLAVAAAAVVLAGVV